MEEVTRACRELGELDKETREACLVFLEVCKCVGLEVCITETYRSQLRQDHLYEQGRSRPGQVVTWTRQSKHTGRRAFDICKNQKGEEYSDQAFFKKCGAIGKAIGLTWGGEWDVPDYPHFERVESRISKIPIRLNGCVKEVEAMTRQGHHYVKLQDLRDNQINIDYDGMPVVEVSV